MSKVIHLGNEESFKELVSGDRVLVDFFATWCGPCKRLGPILDELSEEVDFKVIKVDVDQFPGLAGNYQVRSIPTLVVIENGNILATELGLKTKEELKDLVKNA